MKKIKLLAVAVLLVVALGASLWGWIYTKVNKPEPWQKLSERMPLVLDGWVGEDLPLGPTESVLEAVSRLNYNDYVYRVYRKGSIEVYVYAMFWRQGDISVREMSGHTPDGCWVANGAKYLEAPQVKTLYLADGSITAPAEVRAFSMGQVDHRVEVAWWHIWGKELVGRDFAKKSIFSMVKEIWVWLAGRKGGYRDQLLVRVHSSLPIDEAMKTKPVEVFVHSIPEVCSATSLNN